MYLSVKFLKFLLHYSIFANILIFCFDFFQLLCGLFVNMHMHSAHHSLIQIFTRKCLNNCLNNYIDTFIDGLYCFSYEDDYEEKRSTFFKKLLYFISKNYLQSIMICYINRFSTSFTLASLWW